MVRHISYFYLTLPTGAEIQFPGRLRPIEVRYLLRPLAAREWPRGGRGRAGGPARLLADRLRHPVRAVGPRDSGTGISTCFHVGKSIWQIIHPFESIKAQSFAQAIFQHTRN